ncbi:GGDEF domain [Candidatus Paraburkholderia calva]|nr:GGDEF domain [Candidatus Paraburkholderia calva]
MRGSNLIVVVAPAVDDVTAEWKHCSLIIGTLVIVVSVAFTAVVWLLVFAVRQRDAAQAKLIEIADTDGLTGGANRRRLDAALDEVWTLAFKRGRRSRCCSSMPITSRPTMTPTGTRPATARCVSWPIACRRRACGERDLVARYGGEESVVVFADATPAHAREIAEAMRADVASQSEIGPMTTCAALPPLTVSIGLIVCRPADGAEVDDMMRLADKALYTSKSQGPNRVTDASAKQAQPYRADVEL